jgi:tetratricopeptide (TPR) repeat protein
MDEVVRLYRAQADTSAETYASNLASALMNLGACLWQVGGFSDAANAYEEASDLYKSLARADAETHGPYLAEALASLGHCLWHETGRTGDALVIYYEASALYRQLAESDPDPFRPKLADLLAFQGASLSAMDNHEEAMASFEECIRLYRQLVSRGLDDQQSGQLARALTSLANSRFALGMYQAAADASEEAIAHYRTLASGSSDTFDIDLTIPLGNLAAAWCELGRYPDAIGPATEAVRLLRARSETNPEIALPHLARATNNLGLVMSKLNEHSQALELTKESVDLHRALATGDSDAALALALVSYAQARETSHQELDNALAAAEESASIYIKLRDRSAGAFVKERRELHDTWAKLLDAHGGLGEAEQI